MQSLSDFLASAPKPHLAKLYRRENPDAGLVAASKVSEAVLASALDPERLDTVLNDLEPGGRRLLLAVYASEERGMLESELVRGCEEGAGEAGYWLGALEYELLALRREGEHRSYHGFRELAPLLLPRLLGEFLPAAQIPPHTAWISNVPHVASHFCHFLARAARGELRLTQSGELHRKCLQDLARSFASGAGLSSAAGEEEAILLHRFAVDSELVLDDDGTLRPAPPASELLEDGNAGFAARLRGWWLHRRARGLGRTLEALGAREEGGSAFGASALAPFLAVYEGWDKARAKAPAELSTWENLPRLLRELWILGGIEFAMHRGRVRWARTPAPADAGLPEEQGIGARGLPNFEALVPGSVPLNRLFQVELLAARENDERVIRYRFSKDSVVAGLRAGLGLELLEEVAGWLGFEAPARRVLAEWAATYASASFCELFVLRVTDAARFADLEAFPRFMDLVTEVIPGYGFVLPRQARERARELLRAFDLQPGDESESRGAAKRPVFGESVDATWSLPAFPHGEAAYRHVAPVRKEGRSAREEGAGRGETPARRLRDLEGAIAAQRVVEFTYGNGTARVRAQPLHVLRNRDPMKLIAVDLASGHRNEYELDRMLALRVGEMA